MSTHLCAGLAVYAPPDKLYKISDGKSGAREGRGSKVLEEKRSCSSLKAMHALDSSVSKVGIESSFKAKVQSTPRQT